MSDRRRKLKLLLLSTMLGVIVFSLLGEALIRRSEKKRTSVPETMPSLYYPHSRLRYALVRNSNYYGWAHINGQGFRGKRDVSHEKPEGMLRIMAVGGSTTFDTTVSGDDRAWAARLQHHLSELAPDRPVEVINAGVPGYRSLDNLIRLEIELYRYQPNIIVLYEVHNDFYEALNALREPETPSDTPDEMPSMTPWGRWLTRNSLLYLKLRNVMKVLNFRRRNREPRADASENNKQVAAALERGAADFERNLTQFVAVANSLGIHVIMPQVLNVSGANVEQESEQAIRQVWELNFPYTTPEILLRGYAQYNDAVRRVAERAGSATYISTANFGLRGTQWYAPSDPIHSNDQGADQFGHKLAEALIASGALEKGTSTIAISGREYDK